MAAITPPPRSSPVASSIVVSAVVGWSVAMVAPLAADRWILAGMVALLAGAVALKAAYAVHITLLAATWMVAVGVTPRFHQWPFHLLAPLAGYALVAAAIAPLRRSVGWLRVGHFGSGVGWMVAATIVVSSTALVLWTVLTRPDLSRHLAALPEMPAAALPAAALGFAFLNAAMEEFIFRGVMLETLDSALGPSGRSVGLQAAAFALLHYRSGFPNGGWGVAMVLIYGAMLGLIRRRSGGLLAPWVAHVAADITIFVLVLSFFFNSD